MLPALDGPGTSDLENLSRCGEVHPLGCLDGLDGAPHPPPVAGVDARDGRDLLPGQVLERPVQSLLVAFDGEHVVAALIADPLGGVHLCVHGVGGDHYPVEVEGLEKLSDGGDLWLETCSLPGPGSARRPWRGPGPTGGAAPRPAPGGPRARSCRPPR